MIFRYVPHHRVPDFMKLGWLPHDSFEGTNHGNYSTLMEFICSCGMEPTSLPR